MAAEEGLWIVQFEGLQGEGAGVVVLVNGRALGGDEAFTYDGHYKIDKGQLNAKVVVSNFRPGFGSVMGISGDHELEISAPLGDGVIQGAMNLVGKPDISIAVKLTKKTNL
jgi:hypothetical protein